ncbi:MAG: caspase family protein [Elusimicrobia bacterium]|nr:caspase family protein [Elusimicrobiota bacterium]
MRTIAALAMLLAGVIPVCAYNPNVDGPPRQEFRPSRLPAAWGHFSGIIGDSLVMTGGTDGRDLKVGRLYQYDLKTGEWSGSTVPYLGVYTAGAVIGDRAYVTGGQWVNVPLPYVFTLGLDGRDSVELPRMPIARRGHAAVAFMGKLFILGGFNPSNSRAMTDAESYDPRMKKWTELKEMPTPRWNHAAVIVGKRIVLLGGFSDVSMTTLEDSVEAYDPELRQWNTLGRMPTGLIGHAAAAVDGKIYVFGGNTGSGITSKTWVFIPGTGRWKELKAMPRPNCFMAANQHNGLIYLTGGFDGFTALAVLWRYDPISDTWTELQSDGAPDESQGVAKRSERFEPKSEVDRFAQRPGVRPNDFAVVIGIDSYRSVRAASNGEHDAATMAKLFKSILGVPEANIVLLTGANAARADMSKFLEEWLPRHADKDSRVYVYFSGHGAPDSRTGGGIPRAMGRRPCLPPVHRVPDEGPL